jgi:organic radical activating enzyme
MQENISIATLPLMEDFYTLQGEGAFQGAPAYFIRLGGCDVGCVWCDVKESWDATAFPVVAVDEMVSRATSTGAKIVVVTGGEPAMYDLAPLTAALKANGMRTHIETSGGYPVSGSWDWVCFSPKKFKAPDTSIFTIAHELKVIIYNKTDYDWAEQFASKVNNDCKLFLQPEWSVEQEILPQLIAYVKSNPKWRISLQAHKYMRIP